MSTQPLFDRREQTADPRGPGWEVHRNERDIVVMRPHYWSHPDRRDPEWAQVETRRIGSAMAFEIQQGERWDVPSGMAYYPEFADRVREVAPWQFEGWYVRDAPGVVPKLPVYIGLDGGYKRPAICMAQYDPRLGIFWAMREARLLDFLAHEVAALLRYLVGLATLPQLEAEHKQGRWPLGAVFNWIAQEKRQPFYGYELPWIPPGADVRIVPVMMKHEQKIRSGVAMDRDSMSIRRIFNQQGINLRMATESWEHREIVMRFLMREGAVPDTPRLLVDSSMKWTLRGLAGGLVQPTTPQRQGGPKRDLEFEDTHDALCNAACGAFPLAYADKLAQLETLQEEQRRKAQGGIGTKRPQYQPTPGSSWGRLQNAVREH